MPGEIIKTHKGSAITVRFQEWAGEAILTHKFRRRARRKSTGGPPHYWGGYVPLDYSLMRALWAFDKAVQVALDFQKRGGWAKYESPELGAYAPPYKSNPEGHYIWGGVIVAGLARPEFLVEIEAVAARTA